jgi:hypothetical protein
MPTRARKLCGRHAAQTFDPIEYFCWLLIVAERPEIRRSERPAYFFFRS